MSLTDSQLSLFRRALAHEVVQSQVECYLFNLADEPYAGPTPWGGQPLPNPVVGGPTERDRLYSPLHLLALDLAQWYFSSGPARWTDLQAGWHARFANDTFHLMEGWGYELQIETAIQLLRINGPVTQHLIKWPDSVRRVVQAYSYHFVYALRMYDSGLNPDLLEMTSQDFAEMFRRMLRPDT